MVRHGGSTGGLHRYPANIQHTNSTGRQLEDLAVAWQPLLRSQPLSPFRRLLPAMSRMAPSHLPNDLPLVLKISELRLMILEILKRCKGGKRALSLLARTCKTLLGPSLDILWDELSDLSPLARCFPPDVCSVTETKTPIYQRIYRVVSATIMMCSFDRVFTRRRSSDHPSRKTGTASNTMPPKSRVYRTPITHWSRRNSSPP